MFECEVLERRLLGKCHNILSLKQLPKCQTESANTCNQLMESPLPLLLNFDFTGAVCQKAALKHPLTDIPEMPSCNFKPEEYKVRVMCWPDSIYCTVGITMATEVKIHNSTIQMTADCRGQYKLQMRK